MRYRFYFVPFDLWGVGRVGGKGEGGGGLDGRGIGHRCIYFLESFFPNVLYLLIGVSSIGNVVFHIIMMFTIFGI